MKKIMLFAAACAALAACNKNVDTTTPKLDNPNAFVKGQEVTLTVSAGAQTKVSSELVTSGTHKDEVNFKWETGDKIKVTVGTKSAEFTLESGAGESSATFKGTMPASGETFDVQYPVADLTNQDLISQTYVANGLPKNKMKMTATGCTLKEDFELAPQYSALRLNLWGSKTVGKIEVIKIGTTDPSFTLDCGTGATIGTTEAESTAFFIVVPAGSFKFSAEIFDSAATPASICKFETTDAKTFTAGEIINMAAKEVKKALPEGALSGEFSVSASTKVHFSKGNLWTNATVNPQTWSFEPNQYDYTVLSNMWGAAYLQTHICHFFWETTGNYGSGVSCVTSSGAISDTVDWGVLYCEKKGLTTGTWRTLSKDEWNYLLNSRAGVTVGSTNNARNAEVKVNNICGLLIFPDEFTWPTDVTTKPTTLNTYSYTWNDVNYSIEDFAKLESAGCVFLPAAGRRNEESGVINTNDTGDYWSSTAKTVSDSYFLRFNNTCVKPEENSGRKWGRSVRLVTAAQ